MTGREIDMNTSTDNTSVIESPAGPNPVDRPGPGATFVSKKPQSAQELLPSVYFALRQLADRQMRHERAGHTLQATALVHEAFLRVMGDQETGWDNRAHFYAAAAEAMRRILVEHARRVGAKKRGGGWKREIANVADLASEESIACALDVDEAIVALRAHDPRAATVAHLRFYAGLSVDETAMALNIAPSTVDREWSYGRAWMLRYLRAADKRECAA